MRHVNPNQNQQQQHPQFPAFDTVSQRDYFQLQLDLMEQRCLMRYSQQHDDLIDRMHAMQTAIDKAEGALNTRLEAMNEIRNQLATQRADFVTNDRLDGLLTLSAADRKALGDKVDALAVQASTQSSLAREQTQKDLDVLRGRAEADIRAVNVDIRALRESRSQQTGSSVTTREFVTMGFAALAIIVTLVSRFLP